jgi:hypothetical protein
VEKRKSRTERAHPDIAETMKIRRGGGKNQSFDCNEEGTGKTRKKERDRELTLAINLKS